MKIKIVSPIVREGSPLIMAIQCGIKLHGDAIADKTDTKFDAVLFVNANKSDFDQGMLNALTKRSIPYAHIRAGYVPARGSTIYGADAVGIDKLWSVSINGFRPSRYIGLLRQDSSRREMFGWEPRKWRVSNHNKHIVILPGSIASHKIEGLPPPDEWAQQIERQIIDRYFNLQSQPSDAPAARRIVHHSNPRKFTHANHHDAHVVVTSNNPLCMKSLLYGIPCIVTGDGVTKRMCSTSIDAVETPRLASRDEIIYTLNDLAWAHWKTSEFRDGTAWNVIKQYFNGIEEYIEACTKHQSKESTNG